MPPEPEADAPLLQVRSVARHYTAGGVFRRGRAVVRAVDGVSLTLARGESLGIVGESGCGKSSLAMLLVRLERPDAGEVLFKGRDVHRAKGNDLREFRRQVQMVFQDPYAALNPRMRAVDIVGEAFDLHPEALQPGRRAERVHQLFALVGLSPEHLDRYPHQFSGGQRQRIGIARAIALDPELLVLDEPVSALDVSVQAQVINLLQDLRARLGLSYVLISHDLSVIGHTCDRVAVMYLGQVVETGPVETVFTRATHPYTQALLSVGLRGRGRQSRIVLRGEAGDAAQPPSGCRFRTRCWKPQPICAAVAPALVIRGEAMASACHFPDETRPDHQPFQAGERRVQQD